MSLFFDEIARINPQKEIIPQKVGKFKPPPASFDQKRSLLEAKHNLDIYFDNV